MKDLFTPKQVARAIHVSESSIKRWCDQGTIPTRYTAGGHRRIPIDGLLGFLRSSKQALVRPELLGLPAATGQTPRVIGRTAAQLTEALLAGDEQQSRRIAFDLFLAEHSASAICDEVIAKSLAAIGESWECGRAEIYQERLACGIAQRVIDELGTLVAAPPAEAPRAIGGAATGDRYSLATSMVELVLREAGWNATSLGCDLPLASLAAAIRHERPSLFWLSCSHIADQAAFLADYGSLFGEFGQEVAFVVGGRALTEPLREQMKYAAYCDTLQHLEAFVQTLSRAGQRPS